MTAVSEPPPVPLFRGVLKALPRYRAGRRAIDVSPELTPFSMASNETPFGPLPGVLAAAHEALARSEQYPDFGASRLIDALSDHIGVPAANIAVGTGSVALLQHLVQTVCDQGDEVVYAWRSFEAYPILTRITGAIPVEVPLTADGCHDVEAMVAAVGPRTRALFVCSPNNPTGTTVSGDELLHLLACVPAEVLVVLDEAYIDFVAAQRRPDVVALMARYPNLVVARTFSKAHGLAGLRVGYVMGHPDVMGAVRAVALPFGVSSVAQAAATASLGLQARSDLARRVASVVVQREVMAEVLTRSGVPLSKSEGNFVWLAMGARTQGLAEALEDSALSVRSFPGEGIRITAALPAANQRAVDVACRFVRDGG